MSERDDEPFASLRDWVRALDGLNYYAVLGIAQGASAEEVKSAFHQFALAFHPDRYRDFDAQTSALAQRTFARGVEAYKVLRDPRSRGEYDLNLARGQLRVGPIQPAKKAPLPKMGAAAPAPTRAKSLVDLCRSPAARLCATNAERLISNGDLLGARKLILEAISKDGGNPMLETRLDDLEHMLHAMGR